MKLLYKIVVSLIIFFSVPTFAYAATYYVSPTGSDANPGTQSQPWKTIRKATNTLGSGDTATILSGIYNEGVIVSSSGITLQASGKVITKVVYVTGSFNTIKGFTITDPLNNAGIEVNGNNNLFEGNEIYHTKQDGIWFFGSNNTFRGNYIHDILDLSISGDPHVDCFQTWGWNWGATNILFEKNICDHTRSSGSNQICMVERQTAYPVGNITFRNNIFIMHDGGYSPLNFHRKVGQSEINGIYVYNNTFYNTTGLGEEAVYMTDITDGQIINNVSIGFRAIALVTGGTVAKNNNVTSGNYGIVDYPNLNFHLTKDSTLLIDKGIDVGVTNDFDGNSRPQGAGYDIGAYEFVSGATPTSAPTSAPTPTSTIKPGDADGNGTVDEADYGIWHSHFGLTMTAGTSVGDFNVDGRVDGIDYTIWLNNYGK